MKRIFYSVLLMLPMASPHTAEAEALDGTLPVPKVQELCFTTDQQHYSCMLQVLDGGRVRFITGIEAFQELLLNESFVDLNAELEVLPERELAIFQALAKDQAILAPNDWLNRAFNTNFESCPCPPRGGGGVVGGGRCFLM